jgi:WD40 repeat protein
MNRLLHLLLSVLGLGSLWIAAAWGEPPGAATAPPARVDRFGDPLPAGALARLGTVRFRHSMFISAAAFSADGRFLATTGYDLTVRVWEAATGKEVLCVPHEKAPPIALALTPDGRTLAVGQQAGTIFLQSVPTGLRLHSWKGEATALAFSADGKTLAAAGKEQIDLWDLRSGKVRQTLEGVSGTVKRLAFSPDGAVLAAAADKVHLWDAASGRILHDFNDNQGPVLELAFSPDAKLLAAGSMDETARLWDLRSGKLVHKLLGHAQGVTGIAFAPDGQTLATGDGSTHDPKIHLWDVASGQERRAWAVRRGGQLQLAFTARGKELASWGGNAWGADAAIRFWDPASGRQRRTEFGHEAPIDCVAFSADGKMLASGSNDSTTRLWEAATGKLLRTLAIHRGDVNGVAFSPAGRLLATSGWEPTICLWDLASGRAVRSWSTISQESNCVVFSPDGRSLASASSDGSIQVWQAATGKHLSGDKVFPHGAIVISVRYSPDGRTLAIGGGESQRPTPVFLLDSLTTKTRRILTGHTGMLWAVDFSPDGRTLVAASDSGNVHLWEVGTGAMVLSWKAHEGGAYGAAFSPEGGMVASGGDDNTVRLWEAATGRAIHAFPGHQGRVQPVAFCPTGGVLASASYDTAVLLWDLTGLTPAPTKPVTALRELESLWTDLAGGDAARAYAAIGRLAGTPGTSVPFLAARVRAMAAADPDRVRKLIADLDDARFAVRDKASKELGQLGEEAAPGLRAALQGKLSTESKSRLERLLEAASGWNNPERLQALRAVQVLERAGTPEARRVLIALAAGTPEAGLTQEAQASAERLRLKTGRQP